MELLLKKLLNDKKKVFVLTNGNIQQQKNKVASIRWKGMKDEIGFYYAAQFKPKPSADAVYKILDDGGFEPHEVLMIGDDEVDAAAAAAAGVDFLHVSVLDTWSN